MSFLTPPTCQKVQQRVIQEQSSLKDLLFFHQIMAAGKNSANPNGPVTRSRIKPSFFICYTLERLWPLPQPKRLRCDIVHGNLGGRRGHCQVFASGKVFRFYRRVLTVNLCEVWFVCYIAISCTKINLFEHCCSSHNRGLAFVISRRRLEGTGTGEHGVAHFKTTKNIPVKIFNLKN